MIFQAWGSWLDIIAITRPLAGIVLAALGVAVNVYAACELARWIVYGREPFRSIDEAKDRRAFRRLRSEIREDRRARGPRLNENAVLIRGGRDE